MKLLVWELQSYGLQRHDTFALAKMTDWLVGHDGKP